MTEFFRNFIPCCFGMIFFLLLFGFVAFMRYMSYRETMELAEKGLVKPERRSGNGTLFWGIGFTAVGAALFLGLLPLGFIAGSRFPLGFGPWLLAGLLPMFFGLGLVLFYVLTREPAPKTPPAPAVVVPMAPPSAPTVMGVAPASTAPANAATTIVSPIAPVEPPAPPQPEPPKSDMP